MIILGIDPGTATTGYGIIKIPDDILGREYIPVVAHFANILFQNELTNGYTRRKFICEWYKYDMVGQARGVMMPQMLWL